MIADWRKPFRRRRQDFLIRMDTHAGPFERNAVEQSPALVKSGYHACCLLRLRSDHDLVKTLICARFGHHPELLSGRFDDGDRAVRPELHINQHARNNIIYALCSAHDA